MENKDQPLHASASEAITNNVRVEVESQFVPDRSQPFEQLWHFIYTVRITNEGDDNVQLISRHWIITDATKHVEEVQGSGVVGEQPVLTPGETFRITSDCALDVHRHHEGHVSDGDGGRRALRRRDRAVRAPRAVHGPLDGGPGKVRLKS